MIFILDAGAMIAFLRDELGADLVAEAPCTHSSVCTEFNHSKRYFGTSRLNRADGVFHSNGVAFPGV